jgi:hypothetical protein
VFEVKCQKIKNMHRPRLSIANPKKKRKRKRKRKRKEKKKKKRVEGREMGARDFQRQP